jgi:hypothetical protein
MKEPEILLNLCGINGAQWRNKHGLLNTQAKDTIGGKKSYDLLVFMR